TLSDGELIAARTVNRRTHMIRPMRRGGLAGLALFSVVAALAVAGAAQAKSAPEATLIDNLTCEGHITINFTNPVTNSPPANSFSASGKLEDCVSPSGNNPNIVTGKVDIKGSGTLSCGLMETYSGSSTYTWYDANGNVLGSSTVTGNGTAKG